MGDTLSMRKSSDKSRFAPLIHIVLLVALVLAVYFLRLDHLTIRGGGIPQSHGWHGNDCHWRLDCSSSTGGSVFQQCQAAVAKLVHGWAGPTPGKG